MVGLTYRWPSSQSTAAQSWRLVEWTSRRVVATSLMLGMLLDHAVDQREERVGVELRLAVDVRARDPQALLEVFLVADQGVELAGDLA